MSSSSATSYLHRANQFSQWLTTHQASDEHDLSGLRDNFNPRARWKAAIAGARALSRFNSSGSRTSTSSKSSGDWRTTGHEIDSDDEDEDPEVDPESLPQGADAAPSDNEFVKVTPPSEDTDRTALPQTSAETPASNGTLPTASGSQTPSGPPTDAHELKREHDAPHQPLEQKVPKELHEVHHESAHGAPVDDHHHDSEDEGPMMPGSFYVKPHHGGHHHGLGDLLRKLHIKSD